MSSRIAGKKIRKIDKCTMNPHDMNSIRSIFIRFGKNRTQIHCRINVKIHIIRRIVKRIYWKSEQLFNDFSRKNVIFSGTFSAVSKSADGRLCCPPHLLLQPHFDCFSKNAAACQIRWNPSAAVSKPVQEKVFFLPFCINTAGIDGKGKIIFALPLHWVILNNE